MAAQPHLLVDITAHGFGHVSQTAAVVNALVLLLPELRVTLRTAAPPHMLQQRFQCKFDHIPVAFDFGMKMASAVDVQIAESALAYREFHADWHNKVVQAAEAMRGLQPDLLLANVPYLSLAAASLSKVRAVAMCSLNWADIYQHYCVTDQSSRSIHQQMLDAYNSAECFLKAQPGMEMPELCNTRSIQPIARVGVSRRVQLESLLALHEGEKLVMIAMGGIEFRLPLQSWPEIPGIRWIVPQNWQVSRADTVALESLKLSFTDVLASCDAIITKPGYGTFSEAACAGIPVLYVTRGDWPEEPYLVQWLGQHAASQEVSRTALQSGDLAQALAEVWRQPRPTPPQADGAEQAAHILLEYLG